MKLKSFEELEIWKEGIALVKEIYSLTSLNGFEKDFSLRDQIRRAAISVPSNIAEGFERNSTAEFKRISSYSKRLKWRTSNAAFYCISTWLHVCGKV